jgi:hypothetical protein
MPIKDKFGQGKNGYGLNYIRARTAETSEAWIRSIFMVMNLLVLIRFLFVRMTKRLYRRLMGTLMEKTDLAKENITTAMTKTNQQTLAVTAF